jgi:chromosome segregation protein
MRLDYVEMSGFRGYSKPVRVEFGSAFTIIDGRNGVGKSSIFDAIEFALLGRLTKYEDATADRESAGDYIWWRGEGPHPDDRYVEVGFVDGEVRRSVRRSMLEDPDAGDLAELTSMLTIEGVAPGSSLSQLLKSSIIRDEHIASLSLDLKETQRYQVLCDAIGALGSEKWIDKAARLVTEAQRRVRTSEAEVHAALVAVSNASSRIAQLDEAIVPADRIRESTAALQAALGSQVSDAQLLASARSRIADLRVSVDRLRSLAPAIATVHDQEQTLEELADRVATLEDQIRKQEGLVEASHATLAERSSAGHAEQLANELANLLTLGRDVGLQEGSCPLCNERHTADSFLSGIAAAERRLGHLRQIALEHAQQDRHHAELASQLDALRRSLASSQLEYSSLGASVDVLRRSMEELGISPGSEPSEVGAMAGHLESQISLLTEHLTSLQSLSYGSARPAAVQAANDAKTRHVRAEEKLGIARRAEARAKAIHDAARRAAGDTLDNRLNQILPLTSELYQRLRPHPIWDDIAYKLRGDVKRFLKLEVGEEINPQFVFSSGQRRATGLAFLLSVQLSLSWSNLKTLMLDDPVQHIDDFRSIHLAEVLGHLVATGKQIICAAEDAALADLLARRLPVPGLGEAKRITLGVGEDGRLSVLESRSVSPMPKDTFVPIQFKSAG